MYNLSGRSTSYIRKAASCCCCSSSSSTTTTTSTSITSKGLVVVRSLSFFGNTKTTATKTTATTTTTDETSNNQYNDDVTVIRIPNNNTTTKPPPPPPPTTTTTKTLFYNDLISYSSSASASDTRKSITDIPNEILASITQKVINRQLIPSKHCQTLIIDQWSKRGRPKVAEKMLMELESWTTSYPDYTVVFEREGWEEKNEDDDYDEDIYGYDKETLELETNNNTFRGFQPSVASYSAAVDAWARKSTPGAAERATEILNEMLLPTSRVRPNVYSFTAAINAWCKVSSNNYNAALKANEIFQLCREENEKYWVNDESKKNDQQFTINEVIVTSLLHTYAKSNLKNRVNLFESIYEEFFGDNSKYGLQANAITYSAVFALYTKKDGDLKFETLLNGALKCEGILKHMLNNHLSCDNLRPSGQHFYCMAKMWSEVAYLASKSNDPHGKAPVETNLDDVPKDYGGIAMFAAQKCEDIIREMGTSAIYSNPRRLPLHFRSDNYDDMIYHKLINTWTSCATMLAGLGKGRLPAQRAEDIIYWMERLYFDGNNFAKPTVYTYSSVVDAWARSGEGVYGAQKAEALVSHFEKLSKTSTSIDPPSIVSYNRVMSAWTNTRSEMGMMKAVSILGQLVEAHKVDNSKPKPNNATYNIALCACQWSGAKDAPEKAEELFKAMQEADDIQLDRSSILHVINTWVESGDTQAISKIMALFNRTLELEEMGACQVEGKFVNEIVGAVLRASKNIATNRSNSKAAINSYSSAIKAAETILLKVNRLQQQNKTKMKLDDWSFHQLIKYLADTKPPKAAQTARLLLHTMDEIYNDSKNKHVKPNLRSYSYVIAVCSSMRDSSAFEKKIALETAILTFDDLRRDDSLIVNHVLYGGFLSACLNLSAGDTTKMKLIKMIFTQCCKDGMLDKAFLYVIALHLNRRQMKELLGPDNYSGEDVFAVRVRDLPADWSRNINGNHLENDDEE